MSQRTRGFLSGLVLVSLVLPFVPAAASTYSAKCLNREGKFSDCSVVVTDDELKIDFDSKKEKDLNVEILGKKIKYLSAGEYSRRRVAEAILLTPWLLFSKKQRDQIFVEYGDGKGKNKIAGIEVKKKYSLALKSELRSLSGKEIVEQEKKSEDKKKKKASE